MPTRNRSYAPADDDAGDREAKRPRTSSETNDQAPASLPPEIWAAVMDCLPYTDVLRASAASRSMLLDVMPRIEMLHILKTSELHVGPTNRFRNVKDVNVYCITKLGDGPMMFGPFIIDIAVDEDAAGRVASFLCRFPLLERAFLGGLVRDNPSYRYRDGVVGYIPPSHQRERLREYPIVKRLIAALSGAFRSGALPPRAWITGLRCPDSHPAGHPAGMDPGSTGCAVCREACRSFPLGQVLDFEHNGSSEDTYREGDSICSLDVCLQSNEIVDIVKTRRGGRELLKSPTRFLEILGRGTRLDIVPDRGETMFVVRYDKETADELKTCCMSYGINPSTLKPDDVVRAIMRSFAKDERDPVPPTDQCHLAHSSFSMLVGLGLPVTESDFTRDGTFRFH